MSEGTGDGCVLDLISVYYALVLTFIFMLPIVESIFQKTFSFLDVFYIPLTSFQIFF